jgi:hypothetical protein
VDQSGSMTATRMGKKLSNVEGKNNKIFFLEDKINILTNLEEKIQLMFQNL